MSRVVGFNSVEPAQGVMSVFCIFCVVSIQARVSRIFRRLFRVYAHVYYSHFEYIVSQKAEAHMNSCFKHFVLFSKHFKLVDQKELEPLKYVHCVVGL